VRFALPCLAILGLVLTAGITLAQDGRLQDPLGVPYRRAPADFAEPPPAYGGPSPFAIQPAYGMSGLGYYYDQPSEHRLGPVPGRAHRPALPERRRRAPR
jgi:hypothetical protein